MYVCMEEAVVHTAKPLNSGHIGMNTYREVVLYQAQTNEEKNEGYCAKNL